MKFCKKCKIKRPIEEFYKRTRGKYISFSCRKCIKDYVLNNLDRIKDRKNIYNNTKSAFLLSSYGTITGQYRRRIKNNFPKDRLKNYEVSISKEDFLNMVHTYEKEKGFVCQVTNVSLTTLRTGNREQKTCPTNFSVDRLDTHMGYSKENIIFVSWEFNDRKKNIRIKDCFAILKLYKERYPEKYESIRQEFKELFV